MRFRQSEIAVLAAAVAFCGLLHELTIAQTLAATLGGTVVRYATSIGLFTFALGAGAWIFDRGWLKTPLISLFVRAQFGLAILGALGPRWVQWADPAAHAQGSALFWELFSYFPLIGIGMISGFELPILMRLGREGTQELSPRILAFDYAGMFVGCLIFPLYLFPRVGVFNVALMTAGVSLVCGLWATTPGFRRRFASVSDGGIQDPARREPTPAKSVLILASLLAFCSMSYELLIAKSLTELTNDEVLSQSVSIGVFLLGLGVGSWWGSSSRIKNLWGRLFSVEICLCLIGAGSVLTVLFLTGLLEATLTGAWKKTDLWTIFLVFALQPLILAVGILSGFELPLLMRAAGARARLLAVNYLGSLAAGLAVPFLILPHFGALRGVPVIALVNLGCCVLILPFLQKRLLRFAWCILPALGIALFARAIPEVEQAYLKIVYMRLETPDLSVASLVNLYKSVHAFGDIERIETPYQTIDMIGEKVTALPMMKTDFALYLNRQPQFSRSASDAYHESFAFGPVNLSGKPLRRALILGGGDGILAGQLLRLPGIESVTLVELDARMVWLARNRPEIRILNRDALEDPRLRLVQGDAFRFVRESNEKFDGVWIDFPYPVSYELSKLFSVEFYSAVQRVIKAGGFAVLDAPIWRSLDGPIRHPEPHEILLSTLYAAGFSTVFAFGPMNPFIYLEPQRREVAFDYARLPSFVTNIGFVNMVDLHYIVDGATISQDFVNSIYFPRRTL